MNELKSALTYGGARSSLFQVTFSNPSNGSGDKKLPFLCRAATIPESRFGVIKVPYFGRGIPEAGDRPLFAPWTVTIINDEDFKIRNAMEAWHNDIQSMETNLRRYADDSPSRYKIDAFILQYSRQGQLLRQYTMVDAWPSEISNINVDWNTSDTIEEFRVTFQYTDWQVSGGNTGSGK